MDSIESSFSAVLSIEDQVGCLRKWDNATCQVKAAACTASLKEPLKQLDGTLQKILAMQLAKERHAKQHEKNNSE